MRFQKKHFVSNRYAFRQFVSKTTYKKTAVIPKSYRTCKKQTFVVSGHLAQSEHNQVLQQIVNHCQSDSQSLYGRWRLQVIGSWSGRLLAA